MGIWVFQTTPRKVVTAEIRHTVKESHQESCTFPHIVKYWALYFKPLAFIGFRIIKYICLNMKRYVLVAN